MKADHKFDNFNISHKIICTKHGNLNIMYLNINSLRNKLSEIEAYLHSDANNTGQQI